MKLFHRAVLLTILLLGVLLSIFGIRHPYKIKTTLSYLTRPVWDTKEYPSSPIINLATHDLFDSQSPEYICRIHNNTRPRQKPLPELWDAIIFSHEIDMLVIHFTELEEVVDRFVILESNVTYSGETKALNFQENKNQFSKWSHKIDYIAFTGTSLDKFSFQRGDFALETQQRNAMTDFINSLHPPEGTLVLIADVDEIPYASTMELIKTCELPSILHLEFIPFVYSFEFYSGDWVWHTQVHLWHPGSYYKHSSKSTEDYITQAGVHCSFCFRYISEFQFKMKAYSHSDRLGDNPEALLDADRIQTTICEGDNIFGMLPESYTFLDLFTRWKGTAERRRTARYAPTAVRTDPERYAYLLPGGCQRKHEKEASSGL
ncbi:glycosyltransferase family 17 protein [Ramaria rubella]|nr:glycosyltransferase family 17 protein [Ramaria rubella]